FKDAKEAFISYQNGNVHLHTRVAVQAGSLNNKTFTEEQNQKLILTTIGKLVFNEILPDSFPFINEPTRSNLEEKTPDIYFVDAGTDVKEAVKNNDTVKPFKKGFLSDIIEEVFKR